MIITVNVIVKGQELYQCKDTVQLFQDDIGGNYASISHLYTCRIIWIEECAPHQNNDPGKTIAKAIVTGCVPQPIAQAAVEYTQKASFGSSVEIYKHHLGFEIGRLDLEPR